MPTLFTIASGLSFLLSSAILILSLFSFTTLSLWINVTIAGLTIVYHSAIVAFSWKKRKKELLYGGGADGPNALTVLSAAYTGKGTRCIIVLFGAWDVALVIWAQVTIMGPQRLTHMDQNAPWNMGIQVGELFLLAFEVLIVGSMMMHSISSRRRAGDSSESARALYEKRLFLPSPVEIQSARPHSIRSINVPLPTSPPTMPIPTIRLKVPVPAKTGYKRTGAWNDVTPGGFPTPQLGPPLTTPLSPPSTITPSSTTQSSRDIRSLVDTYPIPPTPAQGIHKRGGTAWSYVTPGRPSMMQFETPVRTATHFEFKVDKENTEA